MFARVKTSRQNEYLQIVENYRDAGKVRQRVVLYVGHYESIEQALAWMPGELRALRRAATKAKKAYEDKVQTARDYNVRLGSDPCFDRDLAELKQWAEEDQRKVDDLDGKLEALKRLVEEHPELVERDQARAERHRRR